MYSLLISNKDFLTIIISLSALFLSIYNIYKTRKKIYVRFDDEINFLSKDKISAHRLLNEDNVDPFLDIDVYYTRLTVVNTSPNDIGFFGLGFYDNDNRDNAFYFVTSNSTLNVLDDKIYVYEKINNRKDPQLYVYPIPPKKSGVFYSNSITEYYLLFAPISSETKNVNIHFSIAKRSWFQPTTNNKLTIMPGYKTFSKNYKIPIKSPIQ